MTSVLVDSNVILDLTEQASPVHGWSREMLARCGVTAPLIINPIVFGEVSVRYKTLEDVEEAVPPTLSLASTFPGRRRFSPGSALWSIAAVAAAVRRRCPTSSSARMPRSAATGCSPRDLRRYRTYFPTLELIAPD